MKLCHKFGRVISKTSLELPDLSNAFTSAKAILQEAEVALKRQCNLSFCFFKVQTTAWQPASAGL